MEDPEGPEELDEGIWPCCRSCCPGAAVPSVGVSAGAWLDAGLDVDLDVDLAAFLEAAFFFDAEGLGCLAGGCVCGSAAGFLGAEYAPAAASWAEGVYCASMYRTWPAGGK